jgi:transposase
MQIDLWLENPLQIKHSSGVQRGKNDRLDARRIADYVLRFQDKVHLFSLPEKQIISLKRLISERDMYVCDKAKYQSQLTDEKRFMSREDYSAKSKRPKRQIKELELSVTEIKQAVERLIDGDETLKR